VPTRLTKRWQTREADNASVVAIARACGLPFPLARALVGRGFATERDVDAYLKPRLSQMSDPMLLPDMEKATLRIWQAIDRNERIVVFGDYDVDGVSSTALLVKVLRSLGADVAPHLPHRMEDGYGLGVEPLRKCVEAHGPKLVITVDCGTGSVEAVEAASSLGIDVVVTDHHEPSSVLAPALAVVNPKRLPECPLHDLAGVGVTFKLAHALLKVGRDQGREAANFDLRSLLDHVAVGTVADVVPLVEENRIFARYGLAALQESTTPGFRSLLRAAGVSGPVDSYHVGFVLGPRLNAAGRLGDALRSLELLLTTDPERADALARELDSENRQRQAIEAEILEEAIERLDLSFRADRDYGVVIAGESWHPGVIGIVASRLCGRFYRPVVVIALDDSGKGKGSCRSIPGFNMVEALDECSELLLRHGGHAAAAGLEVDAKQLEAFATRFNEVARARLAGVELQPSLIIDSWLELAEADYALLDAMAACRPFGQGNPTPVWGVRGVTVVGRPRIVGNSHLKLTVASGSTQREAIGFGMGEVQVPEGPFDIAFQLRLNHYQGRDSLQLSLEDLRPSRPA